MSPPPQRRRPPTRDSQPETPYRFKKRGCILRLTLIQHCHLKQISFALASVKYELQFAYIHHAWVAPAQPGCSFLLLLMAVPFHGRSKSSR